MQWAPFKTSLGRRSGYSCLKEEENSSSLDFLRRESRRRRAAASRCRFALANLHRGPKWQGSKHFGRSQIKNSSKLKTKEVEITFMFSVMAN